MGRCAICAWGTCMRHACVGLHQIWDDVGQHPKPSAHLFKLSLQSSDDAAAQGRGPEVLPGWKQCGAALTVWVVLSSPLRRPVGVWSCGIWSPEVSEPPAGALRRLAEAASDTGVGERESRAGGTMLEVLYRGSLHVQGPSAYCQACHMSQLLTLAPLPFWEDCVHSHGNHCHGRSTTSVAWSWIAEWTQPGSS